ncbi:MAG: hypothetical protein OCU20_07900 [Methanophagales archaeon]|nr:hypothetical protein [Methanophagales archaeon]
MPRFFKSGWSGWGFKEGKIKYRYMKDKIKRRSIYGEKRPKTLKGMERKFWTGDGRKVLSGRKL